MSLLPPERDPLGVLTSTLPVLERAGSVRIEPALFPGIASMLLESPPATPEWRSFPHWWSVDPDQTTMYVLVLDALNFCFWGDPRWTLATQAGTLNGYYALAAALRMAIDRGEPLLDPRWLSEIETDVLMRLLGGEHQLPLMTERAENLRELGRAVRDEFGGRPYQLVQSADHDAAGIAQGIVSVCPSFNDVAEYDGEEVRFFKRAQILASDLAGALAGTAAITGLQYLTAFADYKVPQVLRELGLISYAPSLAARVDNRIELPPGSREEVEIRAATIWAVESLRAEMSRQGAHLRAFEIDWLLWNIGQSLEDPLPYHRTQTIYY